MVKKLKGNKLCLSFPGIGDPETTKVFVYTDATHASLPSGASQGALIVFLAGKSRIAPIMWQSKKLNRVTKSPLASETMALVEGADAGCLIAAMASDVFAIPTPKVVCYTDSMSLTGHLKTLHVIQDTHLRVDVERIQVNISSLSSCLILSSRAASTFVTYLYRSPLLHIPIGCIINITYNLIASVIQE